MSASLASHLAHSWRQSVDCDPKGFCRLPGGGRGRGTPTSAELSDDSTTRLLRTDGRGSGTPASAVLSSCSVFLNGGWGCGATAPAELLSDDA
jgi:hypothetical protein